MNKGHISVYYGAGKGKTCVALGRSLRALGNDKRVVMIQFMDYHDKKEFAFLENLEQDFRIFHFEKNRNGEEITEEVKKDIAVEIRNAYNFVNKILDTDECEVLMLDGILECVEEGYLTGEDLVAILDKTPDNMEMILTGSVLPEEIIPKVDAIYQIVPEKQNIDF